MKRTHWQAFLIAVSASLILGASSASDLIWNDDDWSSYHYARAVGIDPDIEPGLLVLENNIDDFRFLGAPTAQQGIWSLECHHDTLFMTASPYPYQLDGADVIAYDYCTNNYEIVYQPPEQGLHLVKRFDDKLILPGPDCTDIMFNYGSIYTYEDGVWQEKETLRKAVHVNDVDYFNGRLYATSGQFDQYYEGCGVVWASDDWGETFEVVYAIQPTPEDMWRRIFALGHNGEYLFAQPDGHAPETNMIFMTRDGADWDTMLVSGMPDEKQGVFVPWNGDSLLLAVDNRLFIWTGAQWRSRNMPFNIARWGRGLHEYEGELYGGGQSCVVYRWLSGSTWESVDELPVAPGTQNIASMETYYGRVFLSTWGSTDDYHGFLYVTACEPVGYLESLPHDFGGPTVNGVIAWDDFRPATGCMAAFQVRSAGTLQELYTRPYLGPDGTNATWFETSGTALPPQHRGRRWFQYKVELRAPGQLWMPFLRSVTIEADVLPPGGVEEPDGGPPIGIESACLTFSVPQPNPAQIATTFNLAFSLGSASGPNDPPVVVDVRITDLLGRAVRSTAARLDERGQTQWTWDLRDDSGRRVPAGVFHATARAMGVRIPAVTRSLVVVP